MREIDACPHPNPLPEGEGVRGGIEFFGHSFICDPFGRMLAVGSHDKEEILTAKVDPAWIEQTRRWWPFFRDRRIDAYIGKAAPFARPILKHLRAIILLALLTCTISAIVAFSIPNRFEATATVQIDPRNKKIVNIEGVRENQLVGYGLVVGLNGTGDSLGNSPFTEQSLIAMLERLGVNIRGQNLNTGNVAAVMVTATLPPFTNQGSKIDVSIS